MANDRDDLMRLAAKWRSENGDYPESKRDCAEELERALAQRALQNSAMPERDRQTPRRVAAVALLLSLGYKWVDGQWITPMSPQNGAVPEGFVLVHQQPAMYQQIYRHLSDPKWEECDKATFDQYMAYHARYGGVPPVCALYAAAPAPEAERAKGDGVDRDIGGRIVREAWVRWALTQPNPKPSWLVPYDDLSEPDKEADRQIFEACTAAAPPPTGQPEGVEALAIALAEEVRSALDRQACPDHYMRIAFEAVESGVIRRLASAPQAVQTDSDGVLPALQVGSLPTLNQDEYPALGNWWVQLWAGDEVFARVYGPSPDDAHQRATEAARRLASAQQSVGSEQRGDSARYEVLNGSEVGDA